MKKNSIFDKIILIILMIIGSFLIYLYYNKIPVWQLIISKKYSKDELMFLFTKNNKIGKIIIENGEILRKGEQDPVFDNIYTNSSLYFKDTILTGKNCKAKIILADGTIIRLEDNSLIKLDFSEEDSFLSFSKKPQINLMEGNIAEEIPAVVNFDKEKNKIRIVSKKPTIKKEEILKEIPIELAKEKPINYEEIKNNIPTLSFKEEKREIANIETPKLIEKQKITWTDMFVENSYKNSNYIVNENEINNNFNVKLAWSNIDKYKVDYYLIYQYDLKTKKLNNIYKANKNLFNINKILEPYRTAFKIYAYNNDKELLGESNIKQFVFNYEPPIITHPSNNEVLDPIKKPIVVISWRSTNFTNNYKIQISTDINFENDIAEFNVKNNYIKLSMTSNTYYIRVRSTNDLFESKWSDVTSFKK